MNRSRRRTSRGLIAILVLVIVIGTVSILHNRKANPLAGKPRMAPVGLVATGGSNSLSSGGSASLSGSGSTSLATGGSSPMMSDPPPIQTVTPTHGRLDQPAFAPATRPVIQPPPRGAAWSTLLNNGPATLAASTTVAGAPTIAGASPAVAGSALPPPTAGTLTANPPVTTLTAANPPITGTLADGQGLITAGQLIQARALLNDGLAAGKFTGTDAATAKGLISNISQVVVFSPRLFADDTFTAPYKVQPRDSLAKIAQAHGSTWELLSRINNVDARKLRAGATIKVINSPFFAVVDKKAFTMDVYLGSLPGQDGSMYVTTFRVGLGRDDSTPTGTWAIASGAKLKHPKYYPPGGGQAIEADDPANPLGGYWIALTGVDGNAVGQKSYGIHGTIDPDSIGKQSSMGCIRLKNEDIAMVFELMVEGKSKVLVKE